MLFLTLYTINILFHIDLYYIVYQCDSPTGSGYIGCFEDDSSSRTVDGPLITDNSMTIEQCRDKCYQLNKNIAGLEVCFILNLR